MIAQQTDKQKQFPYDFEAKKEVLFYPSKPAEFRGDILEIGPGRGDLLLAMAEAQPDKKFVAVEIGKKRYFRLIPRIEKRGIKNIFLIRGDARVIIPRYFGEETFEKIFVLFPDPWPKDRHAFRRLLTVEFFWLLGHHLKPEGELILATDVEWYAEWMTENLRRVSVLKNRLDPQLFASELPGITPTFFEEKWKNEGRKIYYLLYGKNSRHRRQVVPHSSFISSAR
ncbi:MAG: tRNA (guanosine(46)-N7)-methyltransferase TrmB [Deltaproteobacteria bacterium]|nr:tRNA (guanosine(46)-N7)-methyltransferase TrmB [Deltaproteobacteria bacterium]